MDSPEISPAVEILQTTLFKHKSKKMAELKPWCVFMTTNKNKNVLYIGMTENVKEELVSIIRNSRKTYSFPYKYKCFYLVFLETFPDFRTAEFRMNQLKKWRRSKKEALIRTTNPDKIFLNAMLD